MLPGVLISSQQQVLYSESVGLEWQWPAGFRNETALCWIGRYILPTPNTQVRSDFRLEKSKLIFGVTVQYTSKYVCPFLLDWIKPISQRSAARRSHHFSALSLPLWRSWILVTMICGIQEWSSWLLDWEVNTARWKISGQVLRFSPSHVSLYLVLWLMWFRLALIFPKMFAKILHLQYASENCAKKGNKFTNKQHKA